MKGRFWIYSAFVVSLAFNISVLISHLAGYPPPPPHNADSFRDRITHDMSGPDAAIVHTVFERHRFDFMDKMRSTDAARENVRAVLGSDPLDPAALRDAMDKARAARAASEEVMEETLIDAARQISLDGRKLMIPEPSRDHHRLDDEDGGPGPNGHGGSAPPP